MIWILSIVSAVFYRAGGTSLGTKWRDFGVPSCMIAYFLLTGQFHWILILCFGLMFAAQTTYFKPRGTDAQWYHWLFVGLAFSFSMLPYALTTGHIPGFIFRTAIVTIFTLLWSEYIGKDWLEEGGRGLIQVITLPLL